MPAIVASNLVKVYKSGHSSKTALDLDYLEIEEGSFFGLLGPNGAGKSTFINILANIINKTSGLVKICGFDLDLEPDLVKSSIGVVPQELVFDPFFTVRETLENYAGYYGIPKAKRKTNDVIEALGLSDKADTRPRMLSGGMRRRMLVAKALIHSPRALILDEPTAGVDIELREQLWDYIKSLNKAGTTIILTTHYLPEVEELCSHLAILNGGKKIINDSLSNILDNFAIKQITFYFSSPISSIPYELTDYNASITPQGALSIKYNSRLVSFQQMLQQITKAGLEIIDLAIKDASLEDVFKHFTKE
jgi:ABC-2 type transport system ATP-binding protein